MNKQEQWVSAKKKPPYNKGVLVFIPDEDNHITAGMWDVSNKWVLLDEYREPECEVTHWMEMPKEPEGYEQEDLPDWFKEGIKEFAKTDPEYQSFLKKLQESRVK